MSKYLMSKRWFYVYFIETCLIKFRRYTVLLYLYTMPSGKGESCWLINDSCKRYTVYENIHGPWILSQYRKRECFDEPPPPWCPTFISIVYDLNSLLFLYTLLVPVTLIESDLLLVSILITRIRMKNDRHAMTRSRNRSQKKGVEILPLLCIEGLNHTQGESCESFEINNRTFPSVHWSTHHDRKGVSILIPIDVNWTFTPVSLTLRDYCS